MTRLERILKESGLPYAEQIAILAAMEHFGNLSFGSSPVKGTAYHDLIGKFGTITLDGFNTLMTEEGMEDPRLVSETKQDKKDYPLGV